MCNLVHLNMAPLLECLGSIHNKKNRDAKEDLAEE